MFEPEHQLVEAPAAKSLVVVSACEHTTELSFVQSDDESVSTVIADAQRLRASMYLQDEAIKPSDVTADGRYISPLDQNGVHFAVYENSGCVGCIRLNLHPTPVSAERLFLSHLINRFDEPFRSKYQSAINGFLGWSTAVGASFVGEVGGWAAAATQSNAKIHSVQLAIAVFAFSRFVNSVGLASAAVRHGSNAMLTRIGGFPVRDKREELPSVYDRHYGCEMQILGFGQEPHPRFRRSVDDQRRAWSAS
jgi:hypothetical protein